MNQGKRLNNELPAMQSIIHYNLEEDNNSLHVFKKLVASEAIVILIFIIQ